MSGAGGDDDGEGGCVEGDPAVTRPGGGGEGVTKPSPLAGVEGAGESSSSPSSSVEPKRLGLEMVPDTGIQRTMSPGLSLKPSLAEKVNSYGSSLIRTGLPSASTMGGGASSPVVTTSAEEGEPLPVLAHTPGASWNDNDVLTMLAFVVI